MMIGLFKRAPAVDAACDLGVSAVALPLRAACAPPRGCPVVVVDAQGHTRRVSAPGGKPIPLRDGELAWVFHPGPYLLDIVPFAAAPEIGLRTAVAVDASDPDVMRHRFDLYLAAEAAGRLDLVQLDAAIETALRRELEQGGLTLPPCATVEEWHAFRRGLNELLYMRFGLVVDDCVPVDLGDTVDHAAQLMAIAARAQATPADAVAQADGAVAPSEHAVAAFSEVVLRDARALRRLFLEFPRLICGVRLAALPSDAALFRRQQSMLQRLDVLSVGAATMPALGLAAPGQPLAPDAQAARVHHSTRAAGALDEAWALLARLKGAAQDDLGALYDELDRIVANLEHDCAARRRIQPLDDADADADADAVLNDGGAA
jgi:hypothetical protein